MSRNSGENAKNRASTRFIDKLKSRGSYYNLTPISIFDEREGGCRSSAVANYNRGVDYIPRISMGLTKQAKHIDNVSAAKSLLMCIT